MSERGKLTVPPKEVEDIVQETYVRVCKAQNTAELRSPQSFIYRIARNLAIDHAKRAETRLSDPLEPELHSLCDAGDGNDQTLRQAVSHEEFSLFCEAVRSLPPKCRRVFVLKKVYGLTQREISKELDIRESTVEKHIALGVRTCMEFMASNEQQKQNTNAGDKKVIRSNVQNFR